MANLNLSFNLLIYEDPSDRNPLVRTPDITKSIQGVAVNHDKSDRITIYPNETKDIVATTRSLSWTSSTELHFNRYIANYDNMRIQHTGVGPAPAFRTNRNIGGGTNTVVSISRVTPYVARLQFISGTAFTLSNVQVNDYLKFEKNTDAFTSPFSETNLGKTFLIQAKGANYIDFIDNGTASMDSNITLGADFSFAVRAMSQGPVKIGDTIEISGLMNPSNAGRFEIVDASPEYIEIINPLGVDETKTMGTDSMVAYEYLIGFVHMRSTGLVKVRFGEQQEWAQLARLGSEGILIASVCTHKIQAFNDGPEPVVISVQHGSVL